MLSQAEAAAAIEQLIVYLKANPAQQRMPLSWSQNFYRAAWSGKAISNEQLRRLCDAYYGSGLKIRMRSRVRQGGELRFEEEHDNACDLPDTKSVFALRAIEIGGKPAEPALEYSEGKGKQYLSGGRHHWFRGKIRSVLPPGKYEVRFEFDWGLLNENAKLDPSFGGRPGQMDRWPRPLVTRAFTVKLPLEVVSPPDPVITLVTDSARDPSGVVSVKSIEVTRKGKRLSLMPVIHNGKLLVPICFRVRAEIGDAKRDMGSYETGGKGSSYTALGGEIDTLPLDLKQLSVVLEPDVETAGEIGVVDEIWGKPIRIENVPLERYDLKEDGAAPVRK
jgi:hypothetical protein